MSNHNFAVPTELEPYVDEPFVELCKEWQSYSREQVLDMMPEAQIIGESQAVILTPQGERDTSNTLYIDLPYMQPWTVPHFITSEIVHRTIAPDSMAIVTTSTEVSGVTVPYPPKDLLRMQTGTRPIVERHVRLLEGLGVQGQVMATGYSKASQVSLGIAAHGSNEFYVAVANADEPNNVRRGLWGMRETFVRSANLADEQGAISDANMPALSTNRTRREVIAGHGHFFLGSLSDQNKAIAMGIGRQDIPALIHEARRRNPDIFIKLGHVVGSRMFVPGALGANLLADAATPNSSLHIQEYSGPGTRRHATGINPIVNALMVKQAVDMSRARQNRAET